MKRYFLITFLFFSVNTLSANDNTEAMSMSHFFEQEILNFSNAIDDFSKSGEDATCQLSKIRLRVRGKAGLDVPFLAKLEIKPFIEFHYSK